MVFYIHTYIHTYIHIFKWNSLYLESINNILFPSWVQMQLKDLGVRWKCFFCYWWKLHWKTDIRHPAQRFAVLSKELDGHRTSLPCPPSSGHCVFRESRPEGTISAGSRSPGEVPRGDWARGVLSVCSHRPTEWTWSSSHGGFVKGYLPPLLFLYPLNLTVPKQSPAQVNTKESADSKVREENICPFLFSCYYSVQNPSALLRPGDRSVCHCMGHEHLSRNPRLGLTTSAPLFSVFVQEWLFWLPFMKLSRWIALAIRGAFIFVFVCLKKAQELDSLFILLWLTRNAVHPWTTWLWTVQIHLHTCLWSMAGSPHTQKAGCAGSWCSQAPVVHKSTVLEKAQVWNFRHITSPLWP